ncbi:helix-hairpin-helix domain-containing protein [Psychroserpens burtonensis]|uniref:Helix-hairpin-helix domain-containing protein n=1 Tax=Psychroserpens burtonensis TaxID=49278 RepID=A0A5C7BCQ1_9FLAO|nr:helix-hairpin-helix domain-containing protein [Psychroserpens burtonensis]TXE15757.1 helix-hairpin-helix domain-containing protein [Psychroserpens burtonensis]
MKSHFTFTKKQRSGIFLLLLIIFVGQCAYYFIDFSSEEFDTGTQDIFKFQAEIDSLRLERLEASKPVIFPFNPNYITDFKGYSLGMSNEEIDRLHAFRETNKWVNSSKDFQKVTKISDSLLAEISPYFKFPDWVTNPKTKANYINNYSNSAIPKTFAQKQDLNTASAAELKRIYGIGEKLSERIVAYRKKYGDFVADVQLQEVYGLSPEVIERALNEFTVKTAKPIVKININKATLDQLVTIKYIDYEIAHNIIEQRTLREGFKTLDELTKVKGFPIKKSEIIRLYLTID